MKIKKSKINIKLLELYLIKLRTYEKYDKKIKNAINININQTLIHFKKVLKIIFRFNAKNKKILFLGFSGLIMKKINKETKHMAIPPKVPLRGLISNRPKFKNNLKYSIFKLNEKPDLIIIFDKIVHYNSILNESYTSKIPIITFDDNLNTRKNDFLYNVPANSDFLLTNKTFFYNCLKFLFKTKKSPKKAKYEKKKI